VRSGLAASSTSSKGPRCDFQAWFPVKRANPCRGEPHQLCSFFNFTRARAHIWRRLPSPRCAPVSGFKVCSLQYKHFHALAEGMLSLRAWSIKDRAQVHGLKFGTILKQSSLLDSCHGKQRSHVGGERDFWCVKCHRGQCNEIWAGLHPGYGPGIVEHSGPGVGGLDSALLSCCNDRWPRRGSADLGMLHDVIFFCADRCCRSRPLCSKSVFFGDFW
jgi:hypothetical protein